MGYDRETSEKFWNMTLQKYLGTDNEELCKSLENKTQVIGYMRLLRRSVRRPNESNAQEKIAYYRKRLIELLENVDTLEF